MGTELLSRCLCKMGPHPRLCLAYKVPPYERSDPRGKDLSRCTSCVLKELKFLHSVVSEC